MSKVKALNKDFQLKVVPTIDSSNEELLNSIKYPVYLYAYPEGVKITIRSGHMRFENGEIVRNLNLKNELAPLLNKSRKIKVTLECVVSATPGSGIRTYQVLYTLSDLNGSISKLHVTIMDMVFEHTPDALDFSARMSSLKVLFRPEEIGNYPKVVNSTLVRSKKEFENLILVYSVTDSCTEFIIASPKSRYKFGNMEDLFTDEGGIAKIDTKSVFTSKVLNIQPKVISIKNKNMYIAKSIEVIYKDSMLELDLDKISVMVASKIWENRNNLIGQYALFSGTLIPGYDYPKYRSFIRFEKL